ncbi:hypothetical protein Ethha_1514 [Ethanoligenens harbinense YUAN-3]|uniref:Uncharacterized protein n=1 Tax=Ethanoligenens harbinense (strain DSM 18485 / JCM 12961 / CGMCC 1.5033 / YUAN-3) TaxID=663278 RepID=E6U7M7_ETHHY|nr:hypothetical protein Ethha_1514 [Ethanoligenens harbinense YUAN-3]
MDYFGHRTLNVLVIALALGLAAWASSTSREQQFNY